MKSENKKEEPSITILDDSFEITEKLNDVMEYISNMNFEVKKMSDEEYNKLKEYLVTENITLSYNMLSAKYKLDFN